MIFQFNSLMQFLDMDGHGVFVWSSLSLSLALLSYLIIRPVLEKRKLVAQLKIDSLDVSDAPD
tara:strand:+ start:414 stop:602 length:189 start_codon:yes stop_codon:yes gene_type:complete